MNMDRAATVKAAVDYSTQPRIALLADPDVDRVLAITMAVAQEVGAMGERLDTLERLLVDAGVLASGAVQGFVPSPQVAAERLSVQEAFVGRLLRVVEQEIVTLRTAPASTTPASSTSAA